MNGETGEQLFRKPVAFPHRLDCGSVWAGARKTVQLGLVRPDGKGDLVQHGQFADPGLEHYIGVSADICRDIWHLPPELPNRRFADGGAGQRGHGAVGLRLCRFKWGFAIPRTPNGASLKKHGPILDAALGIALKDFRGGRAVPGQLCRVPCGEDGNCEGIDRRVETFTLACTTKLPEPDVRDAGQHRPCTPHHHQRPSPSGEAGKAIKGKADGLCQRGTLAKSVKLS